MHISKWPALAITKKAQGHIACKRVNRFRILIESRERAETDNIDIGVITLFDLAGSENERTAPGSLTSQESKFINKVFTI